MVAKCDCMDRPDRGSKLAWEPIRLWGFSQEAYLDACQPRSLRRASDPISLLARSEHLGAKHARGFGGKVVLLKSEMGQGQVPEAD